MEDVVDELAAPTAPEVVPVEGLGFAFLFTVAESEDDGATRYGYRKVSYNLNSELLGMCSSDTLP